jgi:hypothetical protein
VALLQEYAHDRVALALYLSVLMHDAMDDTWRTGDHPEPVDLHTRFLGWLCRRPVADR